MIRLIDAAMINAVSDQARSNPRLRQNHNLHPGNEFPAHRLLNALEPGTYIVPHRHLDPQKDESMIALRGRIGLVIFAGDGGILQIAVLTPGGDCCGVDIPHGTWHTILALEPRTVVFEAKAGPYRALTPAEYAPWAPAEGQAEAAAYRMVLEGLFRGAFAAS